MSGATTVSALDYDGDGDIDLFIGNRMLPGTPPTLGLTSEAVLYLESTWQRPARKRGRMPLYVKAVRMDAFLISEDPKRPVRDAEMLGLSCLQPVQWKRSGNLQFLASTRHGIYLFNNLLERRAYPRLELRAPVDGLPLPLIPPVWSAVASRFGGSEMGILCGLEQTGWVVWYPGLALPGM